MASGSCLTLLENSYFKSFLSINDMSSFSLRSSLLEGKKIFLIL